MESTDQRALRVSEMWLYPVKSMGGHRIDFADVGVRGIPLDRGWAVRDERAGAMRSARYIPRLLLCSARYLPGTSAGLVPHVEITLPDGDVVNSDDGRVHQRLSDALGKEVTLWPLMPEDRTDHLMPGGRTFETGDEESEARMLMGIQPDDPFPDFSGFPPELVRDLEELGVPRGTYFDAFPMAVLTTSSIRHLQKFLPDTKLEVERFRPNVLIDDGGTSDTCRERAWVGGAVKIGSATMDVVMDVPRCTIIAAAQRGGIGKDTRITRAIVKEMRQCIAVYCTVAKPGRVALGDALTLVSG